MTGKIAGTMLVCCFILLTGCGKKPENNPTTFTKADSLTDFYLLLQDSMLRSWNMMMNDDNQKIVAMHNLLQELMLLSSESDEQYAAYKNQLDRLADMRYDRTSLAKPDIVEEYDFASNLLVNELVSLAESSPDFAYNRKMQQLVEHIRIADQRVNVFREEYDAVTARYNAFIQANQSYLADIAATDSMDVKPLFQMSSSSE